MIQMRLTTFHGEDEVTYDLISPSEFQISIRETSCIQFQVAIEEQTFLKFGKPYVILSDIPIELDFSHYNNNYRIFNSIEDTSSHSSRFFYNFFGESDIGLCFEKQDGIYHSNTVNILARKDNAILANEMLNHITSRLDDAVSICFSRSKLSVGYDQSKSFSFSRLDLIEKAVKYLSESLTVFLRENKFSWKTEVELSEQGRPTGPDSVYWVLTNLDKLSPASVDEANLVYNNRGYRLDSVPKENIIKEHDVYENRVLHTFLHNMLILLFEIKENFFQCITTTNDTFDQEYVRFDHTMKKFAQLALNHKISHIDSLINAIEQLKRIFSAKIPARILPGIQPKVTPYVAQHSHYRETFELIENCYKAPAPSFEGTSFLLGLKNLSIVYETSSLLILHETIKQCFNVELTNQCYKEHSEKYAFGGIEKVRPTGEINNYFCYSSEIFDVELLYEPKIYPYSINSSCGDLVDTSLSVRNEYGTHHYCPDFVLKIKSKNWVKPATIILDSKYKDASKVKQYDIEALTRKYLLNIHQVNSHGKLGISPINLLLILFPHDKSGKIVRTVAPQHCLNGLYPVLPQTSAILVKPTESNLLNDHFMALIRVINEEQMLLH